MCSCACLYAQVLLQWKILDEYFESAIKILPYTKRTHTHTDTQIYIRSSPQLRSLCHLCMLVCVCVYVCACECVCARVLVQWTMLDDCLKSAHKDAFTTHTCSYIHQHHLSLSSVFCYMYVLLCVCVCMCVCVCAGACPVDDAR